MPEAIRDADDPPDLGLRPRPSRPAQLSLDDITEQQHRRNRYSRRDADGERSPSSHQAEPPNGGDPQPRNVSGSTAGEATTRLASLKRKLGKSKKAGGFLLDKVSSGDSRRARPSAYDPLQAHSPDVRNNQNGQSPAQPMDGQASSREASFDVEPRSANGRMPSRGTTQSTPQSQRERHHVYGSTLPISFGSPASDRSSRQSTEQSFRQSAGPHPRPASATMDPTQLVRMALNLSESRRMQLDPGHLPSIAVAHESRRVTPPRSQIPVPRSPASANSRERPSNDVSPVLRPATGSKSHTSRTSEPQLLSSSPLSSSKNSVLLATESQPEYIFSPSTLERAQKAKKYMELCSEYRRLLDRLPPLKPCLKPDGAKAEAEIGRPYNPLQYIRNRRARVEHGAQLDSEADGWDDAAHVTDWVDKVVTESQQPGFVADDVVLLPQWSSGKSQSTNPDSEDAKQQQANQINGRKENKVKGFDWKFSPSDLLADAYWLEQDEHKSLIYSKQGSKVFQTLSQPLKTIQARRNRAATVQSSKTHDSSFSTSPTSPRARRSGLSSSHGMTDHSTDEEGEEILHHEHHHIPGLVKKNFFRRRAKSGSGSSDDLSNDETSFREKKKMSPRKPRPNIGPLEKHMQAMIEEETRNSHPPVSSPPPTSPVRNAGAGKSRRLGISGESYPRQSDESHQEIIQHDFGGPLEAPQSATSVALPRISVESYDDDEKRTRRESVISSGASMARTNTAESSRTFQSDTKKKGSSRMRLWQRPKSRPDSQVEVTDFAERGSREGFFTPPDASDLESAGDSWTPDSAPVTKQGRGSLESDTEPDSLSRRIGATGKTGYNVAKNRLFKGGRIGELVRNESSQVGSVVFKRPPPRGSSPEKHGASSSTTDLPTERKGRPGVTTNDTTGSAGGKTRRGSSADAASNRNSPQYHVKNLPTFQSSASSSRDRKESLPAAKDHISRQQDERRLQRLNSRLSSMTPSHIDTSDQESSSNALSRYETSEPTLSVADRRRSYGFGNWSKTAARQPDNRLNVITSNNAEPERGSILDSANLPPPSPRLVRAISNSQRWSIENASAPKVKVGKALVVTPRDVARVRSLLLSACIKAQAICNGADMPRDEVNAFMKDAFQAVGQDLSKLGRMTTRQAHVMAAQLISDRLDKTIQELDHEVERFQTNTSRHLTEQIDDLRERATSDLMPKIQSAGGEADAFVARLTTTHTLAIRQVMDSVEKMLRKRRRRLRYAQRQLFTMIEWSLVGLMWWIWLIVFVLRIFRACVMGVLRAAKWLLWL